MALTARRRRGRLAEGVLVLVLVLAHAKGTGAQGLAPGAAEAVSFEAQAAAAAAVAEEQADWGPRPGAHAGSGEAEEGGGDDGGGAIYSKDGTWTLPATALTAGAACMPHCSGVCMEQCQFRADPATGLVEDTRPCAADCKHMCKEGCRGEPADAGAAGGTQHDAPSLADDAADEASANAGPGKDGGGGEDGRESEAGDTDDGEKQGGDEGQDDEEGHALKDGVGVNDKVNEEEPGCPERDA